MPFSRTLMTGLAAGLVSVSVSLVLGGGNTPFEVTYSWGVGFNEAGMTYSNENPSSGDWAIKGAIDPQKETFRGKIKGQIVNDSGKTQKVENDPVVHEALLQGLDGEFGDSAEVVKSKYKGSKKGKARGSFSGTYSIFG